MDIVAQNDNIFRHSDEVEANFIVSERESGFNNFEGTTSTGYIQ
jgi:hypothetical protein